MPRLFDETLSFALKSKGAVLIVGPKWCGKTRTSERYAKTEINLLPLESRQQYIDLAKAAPHLFLNQGEKPLLIDEWQIISFIWDSLKVEIDENDEFGQYILTGSVTDKSILDDFQKEERHTGNGRIVKKRMRTMSLFESGEGNGSVPLTDLKNNGFQPSLCNLTIEDYAFLLCRGGWPLSVGEEKNIALQQAIDYFEGLVTEDIFSLEDVPLRRNEELARRLLRSYSRAISSQANDISLKKDLGANYGSLDDETLSKYLLALERLYVVEELPAWNPNLRSKTTIRTKNTRHLVDPSIATAALGVGPNGLFADMKTFGLLFESMAIRDLRIYADSLGARLYHYRDKSGMEADAVLSFADGDWALIEVKLGDSSDIDEAAKKLLALSKDIDEDKKKPAFLLIITKDRFAYKREDGVYVVPLGCLKN